MKKKVFFLILLLIPIAYAEVDINIGSGTFNLGDKIAVSLSVIETYDVTNAFIRADMECSSDNLEILSVTKSLEKDYRENINFDDVLATKNMLGKCRIRAIVRDSERNTIDNTISKEFTITNNLKIECSSTEALPGKKVEITCTARKISDELISEGTAYLNYRRYEFSTAIGDGTFAFKVMIKNDTPSGINKAAIKVEDNLGNYADIIVEFDVIAIPSSIETRINSDTFKPGDKLEITPIIYDQVSEVIPEKIKVDLLDPEDNLLISKEINSSESISYSFDSFSSPGTYKIASSSLGLIDEKKIIVEAMKNIDMNYDKQKVTVKNIGNIRYEEEITIILENNHERYLINKRIRLSPGESQVIDLSKEVPKGNYDIILPKDVVNNSVTENLKNQNIDDNRSLLKKAGTGLGFITGAAVSTIEYATKKPYYSALILSIIIIGIMLFYSKDFILQNIKRIKIDNKQKIHIEDKDYADIEDIFKDFDYEKKDGERRI